MKHIYLYLTNSANFAIQAEDTYNMLVLGSFYDRDTLAPFSFQILKPMRKVECLDVTCFKLLVDVSCATNATTSQ